MTMIKQCHDNFLYPFLAPLLFFIIHPFLSFFFLFYFFSHYFQLPLSFLPPSYFSLFPLLSSSSFTYILLHFYLYLSSFLYLPSFQERLQQSLFWEYFICNISGQFYRVSLLLICILTGMVLCTNRQTHNHEHWSQGLPLRKKRNWDSERLLPY